MSAPKIGLTLEVADQPDVMLYQGLLFLHTAHSIDILCALLLDTDDTDHPDFDDSC